MPIIQGQFNPRPYQIPLLKYLDNGGKRAVICWNRRSGKDKTCFNYMIGEALQRVGTYYYFLPTFTLAKRVIWDNIDNEGHKMLDHIPKGIRSNTNISELKIELKNGSIIQLIGADEFKKGGVGVNPIGVVFSEFSLTDPEAWNYVSPILASNGGWAIFNFTPRGINHAFNLLQKAKENKDWFSQVLTVENTHSVSSDTLNEEKNNLPQDFFEQEYYCKFIEGAGSFFKAVDDCITNETVPADLSRRYQIGVDLAKFNDYTVITPFDLTTFTVGKQDRFNQIDYNLQKSKIELSYHKYAKGKIVIDSTGVGEPIFDDLKQKIPNILPFHFTEQSRKDLLVNLQLLLEQRKIKIPNDPTLLSELRSVKYELTERGRTRIKVPDGLHDDCIMSLALAVWDIPDNPVKTTTQYQKEYLRQFDFYNKQKEQQYFTGSKYLRRF